MCAAFFLHIELEVLLQARVAAAENMRYDESLKSPLIKPEKTILHPGEVLQPGHLSALQCRAGQAEALLMPQPMILHY